MTRFARAKGSKASNERKEEDPTPWHLMRQQLADQLTTKSLDEDSENCKQSLKKEILKIKNPPIHENEVWCEFHDNNGSSISKHLKQKNPEKKEIKTDEEKSNLSGVDIKINKFKNNPLSTNVMCSQKPLSESKKQLLSKQKGIKGATKNTYSESSTIGVCATIKSNQNQSHEVEVDSSTHNKSMKKSEEVAEDKINPDQNKNNTIFNDHKNLVKNKKALVDNEHPQTYKKQKRTYEKSIKSKEGSFDLQTERSEAYALKMKDSNKVINKKRNQFQEYNWNNQSNVQIITANDRQIKIVKYEAFWIKVEDAIKLRKLKKTLKHQKVSSDKIKTIMKLERRKAEKALAREKTNVCYICRKFGHKFSDCPDTNVSEMTKSGICFKCGSLEHTHFQCKVTQTQDFRYAVCFVCKEQGHIARQCPLNTKGQYPKGGSCHLCGEITHLRKDCPKAIQDKPSKPMNTFTAVKKMRTDLLEDISENAESKSKTKTSVTKNKVVKF